jgi:CelD/BcsL family acetyltransferase involved in cellulose biosynthesis
MTLPAPDLTARKTFSQVVPTFRTDKLVDQLPSSSLSDWERGHEGRSVLVSTTIQAIEELRPVWEKWPHGFDTDVDYYLQNVNIDPTILHPHVLTVYQDGAPVAMLVGQVRKRRMSNVVSFVSFRGTNATVLEILSGGRMGQQSSAIDALLASELLKIVKSGRIDLVFFQRLPLHSELFREVQRLRGLMVRDCVFRSVRYTVLSVPDSAESRPSIFTGKARREVRRKTRILQRTFSDKVEFKCFSHPAELDAGISDAMTVAITTWQHHLGFCSLSDTPHSLAIFRFMAEKGWLRICILYVNGLPCAFLVGQLYNKTFYCQHAGYHPDFARFSVGSLLTARTFEDLAAAGARQFDLGDGREEHNRRLGCQESEEVTVHVYCPTLRGLWLNIFFGATQVVRSSGHAVRVGLQLSGVAEVWHQLLSQWRSRVRLGTHVRSPSS